MEIRGLLALLLVEIEAVVYADRPERRYPADSTPGRVVQVGQIELRLEAVHVADVDERCQPDVERQRDEVFDIGEDFAGAADAVAEFVDRRDLSSFEAADGVRAAEVKALEYRQILVAEAEAVPALHASRQDMTEPDRLEIRHERRELHEVVIAAQTGGVGGHHELASFARRLDTVAAVTRDRGGDRGGHVRARLFLEEDILHDPDVRDVVLRQAIAHLPAPELLERVAQPHRTAERLVVVFRELPLRTEHVEACGERTIEQPGLGEADLPLLDLGARAYLDRRQPAATEEVVLREVDRAQQAVGGGESTTDREQARRPLGDVDVDDDLRLVRAGRRVDIDLLEVAEVGEALLAALQLAQREDLTLGHLQLAAQDLVLAAHVARDIDALDVDGGPLVDVELDRDPVFGLELELGVHLGRGATNVGIQLLDRLDRLAQRRAREHVAGLELDLAPYLGLRQQRHPREGDGGHAVLRAFDHDDVDDDPGLVAVDRDVMRFDARLDVPVVVVELQDAVDVLVELLTLHRSPEDPVLPLLGGHGVLDLLVGEASVAPDDDPVDLHLPAFVDREHDLHVAVGELLDVRRDLDLEVPFTLVVVLHPLARALDLHRVVDAAEFEVDLILQLVGGDRFVPDEVNVPHERALHDDEPHLHAALEVLNLELHVVEEAKREDRPHVLGELGRTEERADGRLDAAEDHRLLHAAIAL